VLVDMFSGHVHGHVPYNMVVSCGHGHYNMAGTWPKHGRNMADMAWPWPKHGRSLGDVLPAMGMLE